MKTVKQPVLTPRRARKAKLMPLAREWRRKGHSYQEIADALGVSIMTSWSYCHDVPAGDIYEGARQ
jgi:hypothetical protein